MFSRSSLSFISALALIAASITPPEATAGTNSVAPGPVFVPPASGYGPVFTPPARGERSGRPAPGNATPEPGEDVGQWAATWMANASKFCAALADSAYQIDCLAERIDYIAWQLPGSGNYAAVRAELLKAARDLQAVANKYQDSAKPGRVYATPASGTVGPQRSTRAVAAVRPAQRSAAAAEARAIVERTETVLLRSSAGTGAAAPQITRIAAAVGSNKVLLRST